MSRSLLTVVYLTAVAVGFVIRLAYTRRGAASSVREDRTFGPDTLLVVLTGVGMVLPLVYLATSWPAGADYTPIHALSYAGVPVFAAALWLLWRSHADLGSNWSPTPQIKHAHTLITAGVYRFVRHPMYAAHLLWAVAQVLLIPNWIAGPAMLVFFVPMYLVRVPREERMMLEHFGDAYRRYRARTGAVLPRFTAWRSGAPPD